MNGIIIDELSSVELPVQSGDEFPIERGQAMYKVDYDDLIGNDLSAINGDISDLQTSVNSLQSNVTNAQTSINALESGIAIIVNGNSAARTVPSGGYAYLKNNQYGLAEGLYINTNSADFPTGSSVAATSTYFTAVSEGGLNAIQQATAFKKLWSGEVGQNTTITLSESITHFKAVLVVAKSNVGTAETRIIPVDAINYIPSAQTVSDDAWVVGVMYQSSVYAMTLIGFMSDTQIYVMDRNVVSGWSYYRITAVYGMN